METTQEQKELNREKLIKQGLTDRLDIKHPSRPQITMNAEEVLKDEDENTLAKSILDDIIEETENDTKPS